MGMLVALVLFAAQDEAVIQLPAPDTVGKVTVEQALARRRSIRSYQVDSLTPVELGQVLWAAQGQTTSRGFRTAPSAGATYPMELYVATGRVRGLEPGLYRYLAGKHALELVREGELLHRLSGAALGQTMIEAAAATLVLACEYRRTTGHYGERGRMYVHMEAGHIGQNVHLQCEALGLGTCMVGAFSDRQVQETLGIEFEPLYLMPMGRKKTQ